MSKKDIITDLVIIGAGGAGLAAATAAAETGVNAVVIEKRSILGGTSAMAFGPFAAESPAQKRQGIIAPNDDIFKLAMQWAHLKTNVGIIRAYINKSGDTIRWLEEKGLHFTCLTHSPIDEYLTWHVTKGYGAKITKVLAEEAKHLGVRVFTRSAGKKIITNSKGNITGVLAEQEGHKFTITTRSVIIATGGYGANKALLEEYCPDLYGKIIYIGTHNTGDGLSMAVELGAATEGLGILLMGGPLVPINIMLNLGIDPNIVRIPLDFIVQEPSTIWVNKSGIRFIDECNSSNRYKSVNASTRQPDGVCYVIFDSKIVDNITENYLIDLFTQEPSLIWVNKGENRFIDECNSSNRYKNVNASTRQPDGTCYRISGSKIVHTVKESYLVSSLPQDKKRIRLPEGLKKELQAQACKGKMKIAYSWVEIANWVDCNPQVLQDTIDDYNIACDQGSDPIFAKDRTYLIPLRTPPYYAIKCVNVCLNTMGGIKINERMEVVDKQDNPISGLYAAGVDTGGWVSDAYPTILPGTAFGFALNSGRIAGENAAKYIKLKS